MLALTKEFFKLGVGVAVGHGTGLGSRVDVRASCVPVKSGP